MTTEEFTDPGDSASDTHDERDSGSPNVRVDCYVRASALAESVYETIDRLESLEERGDIDDLTVTPWPEAVALTEPMADSDVVETFERFEAWAEQWNTTIRPPFSVQDRSSEIADRSGEVLVTPLVCVAVYVEGALRGVFPYASGEDVCRVEDAIEAIEAGQIVANGSTREAPDPSEREVCPVCSERLVNGQGLYHCPDCERPVIATENGRYTAPPRNDGPDAESVRTRLEPQ